jgi:hypothetical protein
MQQEHVLFYRWSCVSTGRPRGACWLWVGLIHGRGAESMKDWVLMLVCWVRRWVQVLRCMQACAEYAWFGLADGSYAHRRMYRSGCCIPHMQVGMCCVRGHAVTKAPWNVARHPGMCEEVASNARCRCSCYCVSKCVVYSHALSAADGRRQHVRRVLQGMYSFVQLYSFVLQSIAHSK